MGPTRTYLNADSPYIWQHHRNWRMQAIGKHGKLEFNDLMFTSPITLSEEHFEVIRESLLKLIQQLSKTVEETDPQRLACLNIDWFLVK